MIEVTFKLSPFFLKKLSKELIEAHELDVHYYTEESILDGFKDYFGNSEFVDQIKSYFIDAIDSEELIQYCEPDLSGLDMDVNGRFIKPPVYS